MYKKIIFWSPLISHVGTINAVLKSALSLKNRFNYKIYIIDILGEFSNVNKNEFNSIIFLKIFNVSKFLPKTGIISKFFLYLFCILAIPKFIYILVKYKPDFIFSYLLSVVPLFFCKFFFKKINVICSIQGYPRLNFLRLIIWKIFYLRSNYIITMTNKTRDLIINKIRYNSDKISTVYNPIIHKRIKLLSLEKLNESDQIIFKKKVIISVGRLTRQKNYMLLLEAFNNNQIKDNYNLLILGEGEERNKLENYIKLNELTNNVYLKGFSKNPFKFIAKSSLYVSSSRWEEPGHSILEAGYLNLPIITSDCPNGPKELYTHKKNAFVFKSNDVEDLYFKIKDFENIDSNQLYSIKIEMKKLTKKFTQIKFKEQLYEIFKKIEN